MSVERLLLLRHFRSFETARNCEEVPLAGRTAPFRPADNDGAKGVAGNVNRPVVLRPTGSTFDCHDHDFHALRSTNFPTIRFNETRLSAAG